MLQPIKKDVGGVDPVWVVLRLMGIARDERRQSVEQG